MNELRTFLQGKKTYLAALGGIIAVITEWVNTGNINYELLLISILGMTGRAALKK